MNENKDKHIKDFDAWIVKKKTVHERTESLIFKERDIWWCYFGCNIGSEEDGKGEDFVRPVVIFQIFTDGTMWVIPLTTKKWPVESRIHYTFTCSGIIRAAKIHQMRSVSVKRLDSYIDRVSFDDFQKIRRYVRDLV